MACTAAQRDWQRAYYQRVGGNKNRKPEHKQSAYVWGESRKRAYAKRRALRAGTASEPISPTEIFQRDNWTCGICLLAVDPTAKYPDPHSPSLDHVIALSLGGEHVQANVRCTHLICNVRRGARVD